MPDDLPCNASPASLVMHPTPSHPRLPAGEKQQKGKGLQIPFLHQVAAPIGVGGGGGGPRMPPVGMKLQPGVPVPTWICDTVSASHGPSRMLACRHPTFRGSILSSNTAHC